MREQELSLLCERIAAQLDVYEFLDVLGWNMTDLVLYLKDEINAYSDEFEDCLDS